MKYVALLSGGKDSCYNLLHCRENDHELVAAASLGPEPGIEELDSYLYQTVGQDVIHLVAQALGVPLFRRVISGQAVEQGSEYGGRNAIDAGGVPGDETEDMYALLSDVKSHHPDIQGVSVGAILSNYQRVRVEHVCRRLSLVPLCYLWQRDQAELLSEMIEAGMEAILIKIAGIGLNVEHLARSLEEMKPTLLHLNELYGSHICGEGGEYETLTIDCPLFRSRIMLIDVERVIHSQSDFAPVAFLRIKGAALLPKSENRSHVHRPPLLENKFSEIQAAVALSQSTTQVVDLDQTELPVTLSIAEPDIASRRIGPWVAVTNVHRKVQGRHSDVPLEEEIRECFRALREELFTHSLNFSQICIINLCLASINDFASVNAIYATYFGTSPPARACVAVDLPSPLRVKLDCIAFADQNPAGRQALHVQGLSYWAPANIGPYSQAVTVGERVFISGQIGLMPSNLALPSPKSLAMEAALSCQHVERITRALKNNTGGGWEGHTQIALYWLTSALDLVHVRNGITRCKDFEAPTLFLGIKSLPRDALVEKQVLLHTGRCLVVDADDEEPSLQARPPRTERGDLIVPGGVLHWETSQFKEGGASCATICVRGQVELMDSLNQLEVSGYSFFSERTLSVRLFYKSRIPSLEPSHRIPPITFTPCRFISTRDADDWDYAMCFLEK